MSCGLFALFFFFFAYAYWYYCTFFSKKFRKKAFVTLYLANPAPSFHQSALFGMPWEWSDNPFQWTVFLLQWIVFTWQTCKHSQWTLHYMFSLSLPFILVLYSWENVCVCFLLRRQSEVFSEVCVQYMQDIGWSLS